MAKQNESKWVPLYCQWRNYTIGMFKDRARIFYVTENGQEKTGDEIIDILFDYNKEHIFKQMSEQDKLDFGWWKANGKGDWATDEDRDADDFGEKAKDNIPKSGDDLDKEMVLPFPCVIFCESTSITAELAISQTNFQQQEDDFYAFADEKLESVLTDPQIERGNAYRNVPGITVLAWCKALNPTVGTTLSASKGDRSWIDLSDYVTSLNTNVGSDSGSFSISIPFLSKRKASITVGGFDVSDNSDGYKRAEYQKIDFNSGSNSRGAEFFQSVLSSNDLIFISLSDIRDDTEEKIKDMYDSENIKKLAASGSFDMIALVDNVSIVKSSPEANATIEISGRDLNKLLIDDGSFFFNPSTTNAPSEVFFNEQGYAKQGDIRDVDQTDGVYNAINRMRRVTNELDIFVCQTNLSIDYIIKGVISQLANIEIVPSDCFDEWEDRTTWLEIHPDEELKEQQKGK